QPWKSIKPISTFPPSRRLRRDELISQNQNLRATHSEGKVTMAIQGAWIVIAYLRENLPTKPNENIDPRQGFVEQR
ncbi:MAG: hypothetical protein ABR905_18545, partial [Terracidiphilus sp.]